jgi:hypothetical protein
MDFSSSLERAAFITLSLLDDLNTANEYFTRSSSSHSTTNGSSLTNTTTTTNTLHHHPIQNPEDTEHAQFILKLAPRIRRLEWIPC